MDQSPEVGAEPSFLRIVLKFFNRIEEADQYILFQFREIGGRNAALPGTMKNQRAVHVPKLIPRYIIPFFQSG